MTSSLAGIPSGKTDFSKASRSIPSRLATAPGPVRVAARLLIPEPPVAREDELRVGRLIARFARPATPCARLRCAPSAAARLNVRPHSGQTNAPASAAGAVLREAARLLLARLPVVARLLLGRLLLARLLLACAVLADCRFGVDMSPLPLRGDH
jgi:hypothetical protein